MNDQAFCDCDQRAHQCLDLHDESNRQWECPGCIKLILECKKCTPGPEQEIQSAPIGTRSSLSGGDQVLLQEESLLQSQSPPLPISPPSNEYDWSPPRTSSSISKYEEREPWHNSVSREASYPHSICDANIASILYSSPLNGERLVRRKRKKKRMEFLKFWRKKREPKPECVMKKKRSAFFTWKSAEQERLRKLKFWNRVKEGRIGKSSLELQEEWHKKLRHYDASTSWQRHVGHDTRKRHRDQLIKAAVHQKPISDLQALRRDAMIMEDQLFGNSKHLDEYKTKVRQIIGVFQARREAQKYEEAYRQRYPYNESESETDSLSWKLGRYFNNRRRTSWWGGRVSPPEQQHKCLPSTPCTCRESSNARFQVDEDFRGDDVVEDVFKDVARPFPYKPNLKRIKPSYRDKNSALGWNHRWPQETPDQRMQKASTPQDNLDEEEDEDVHEFAKQLEAEGKAVDGDEAERESDSNGEQGARCDCFRFFSQPDDSDLDEDF